MSTAPSEAYTPNDSLITRIWQFRTDPIGYLMKIAKGKQPVFKIFGFGGGIYFLNSPEAVNTALQSPNIIRDIKTMALIKYFLAGGVATLSGVEHNRRRKLNAPAYQHHRVEAYAEIMVNYTDHMMDELRQMPQFEVVDAMTALTLRIIAKTLLGEDPTGEFVDQVGKATKLLFKAVAERRQAFVPLPLWVPTPAHLKQQEARKILHDTMSSIVRKRRAEGGKSGDLISLLMQAVDKETGETLTDSEIAGDTISAVVAGHDTVANLMAWVWYLLHKHPEVAQKLYAELDSVWAGRLPTAEDIENMPYLKRVIKEALRVYPPAWAGTREPITDVVIEGAKIPKGSLIFVSSYVMHHTRFEDADAFIPERWEGDFEKNLPSGAYFPFSLGPQSCIAFMYAEMQARLILATIASKYVVEPVDPNIELSLDSGASLPPKEPFYARLKPRS
jgi:cytochrome P450